MSHVFISYLREDRSAVDRFVGELRRRDIPVWLDREKILPGQRWQSAIRTAIREGAHFIVCFSKSYDKRNSSYINEELTLAIEELRTHPVHRAWFIPVLLEQCSIPDRSIGAGETLRDIHWVDLSQDWNAGIERLAAAITAEQESNAAVQPIQTSPNREKSPSARDTRSKKARTLIAALGLLGVAGFWSFNSSMSPFNDLPSLDETAEKSPPIGPDDNGRFNIFIAYYPSREADAARIKKYLIDSGYRVVQFDALKQGQFYPRKSEIIYYSPPSQKKSNILQESLRKLGYNELQILKSRYYEDPIAKYKIYINLL